MQTKEEALAEEIRQLNRSLLEYQDLPKDWHKNNPTTGRMVRTQDGRYID